MAFIDPNEIKERSEMRIKKYASLKINNNLPLPNKFDEKGFRDAQEIAQRISILSLLIGLLHKQPRKRIKKLLKKNNLLESLSTNEKKLFNKLWLTRQDKIDIGWFSEAIEILGWTIGLWKNIEILDICDEDKQVENTPHPHDDYNHFIDQAKLIKKTLIYSEADFIYRMYWIAKRQTIGKLKNNSRSAYKERLKAIHWVINKNSNWDEVSIDT